MPCAVRPWCSTTAVAWWTIRKVKCGRSCSPDERHRSGCDAPSTLDRRGERGIPRRAADEELILPGEQFPIVFLFVEYGEELRLQLYSDGFCFTGRQAKLLPSGQPLGRFFRFGGQAHIHLRDLGAGALARVAHGEGDAVDAGLQRGVGERGVREAVPEGEQGFLGLGIEPLVANLQAFGG